MKKTETFDILWTNIDRGRYLIEASAGTGKTYAIVNIYLRLIIEKNFKPAEILVVTFTIPATAELRDRLRRILKEAYSYLENRYQSIDETVAGIINKALEERKEDELRNIIKSSILNFDEAAIFTIHAFCLRMLSEKAFESKSKYELELIKDESALIKEATEDFWRETFYDSEFLSGIIRSTEITISKMVDAASFIVKNPDVNLLPEFTPGSSALTAAAEIEDAAKKIMECWQENREVLISAIPLTPLKAEPKKKLIPIYEKFKDAADTAQPITSEAVLSIKSFNTAVIQDGLLAKAKGSLLPLVNTFTDLCGELNKLFTEFEILFMSEFLNRFKGKSTLSAKKARLGLRSYADILTDAREALRSNGKSDKNSPFALSVRKQFPAAMIDEFQDTDPIQYEIFNSIFNHPDSTLFMIGDPKQSIYRFRGADIFAYLQVKKDKEIREFTLGRNYRTIKPLVEAVDSWFKSPRCKGSFVYDELSYDGVDTPEENRYSRVEIDQGADSEYPFIFCHSAADNKSEALKLTVKDTALRILNILNLSASGRARIIKADKNGAQKSIKNILPGDIAVLVRKHDEASAVQRALSKLRIPSVVSSTGNIFESREATEMLRILDAVESRNDPVKIRTALSGIMIGLTPIEIFNLTDETGASEYEIWLNIFCRYNDLWQKKGFISMFMSFIEPEEYESPPANLKLIKDVRLNILQNGGGERALTNILHLAELIHKESIKNNFCPADAVNYLYEKMTSVSKEPESSDYEIRLDTDADAVQLVTIHSSKGLEYPFVFAPFLWSKGIEPRSTKALRDISFHKDGALYCDLKDIKTHINEIIRENLAEEIRLMYVAMTRAIYKLYVYYPEISSKSSRLTSIYYLMSIMSGEFINVPENISTAQYLKTLNISYESLDIPNAVKISYPEEMQANSFSTYSQTNSQTINSVELMEPKTVPIESIKSEWGIISYSGLAGGAHQSTLNKERIFGEAGGEPQTSTPIPENNEKEITAYPETSFFHFPRKGKFTGSFCHEILEDFNFSKVLDSDLLNDSLLLNNIESKLYSYGLSAFKDAPDYHETVQLRVSQVIDMLSKVLTTPIPEINETFSLSKLGTDEKTSEMEFYYPAENRINQDRFDRAFEMFAFSELRKTGKLEKIFKNTHITFNPSLPYKHGFITGSIDLVFTCGSRYYIADWKASWLGADYKCYSKEAILENMSSSGYFIQHGLYSLALHNFIKSRNPLYSEEPQNFFDKYFGGIFYFYLRGMNGIDPDYGFIFDKPHFEYIDKLSMDITGKQL